MIEGGGGGGGEGEGVKIQCMCTYCTFKAEHVEVRPPKKEETILFKDKK